MGVSLPPVTPPIAAYVPARIVGGMFVQTSGQLPMRDGKLLATGPVGAEISVDAAKELAYIAALNAIAAAAHVAGGIDRLGGVVRVGVFVAAGADFHNHSQVANGASALMEEVFGDLGKHARAAVGCSALPLNSPVEVEVLFELAAGNSNP